MLDLKKQADSSRSKKVNRTAGGGGGRSEAETNPPARRRTREGTRKQPLCSEDGSAERSGAWSGSSRAQRQGARRKGGTPLRTGRAPPSEARKAR